ncbi:hypothetical protein [Corynebacterium sp. UBA2622]|uniref:hypothetical protein n=1 Tax=Corynebacterium sp. UBA2622 TaxID=1946393 RepID=UPI0025C45414|nr:hypothetical protein [Corynebacterium sp. UBA2622]
MTAPRVIRTHATAAVALAAAWLAAALILSGTPSVPFRAFNGVLIAIGSLAVMASLLSVIAYWRARRSDGAASGGILFVVSALCLIASWGSSVIGWAEEFRAGMSLPIINLLFLLLPVGVILSLAAAWRAAPSSSAPGRS